MIINATSIESQFDIVFSPAIDLTGMQKKLAFYSIETVNNIPNITEKNSSFSVEVAGKVETVTIETGRYSFRALCRIFNARAGVKLSANEATLRSGIEIPSGIAIGFDVPNSIGSVLGFTGRKLAAGMHYSDFIVKISDVNAIFISCDIVTGSRNNGRTAQIVFKFFPEGASGTKIVKEARHMKYLPFADSRKEKLETMRISITDQDMNPIDFRGEPITLTFFLE